MDVNRNNSGQAKEVVPCENPGGQKNFNRQARHFSIHTLVFGLS